jgi:hypothetical protein
VAAKTEETMGYFTRNEIPFQYALADAFTICDGYHQSIMGPTSPNGCTCGRARRAASSPTRTTTRWTSGLTPARARSRPTPGVVDRRPGGLQRAPVLHPRLRGALREHRASDAVLEPRSVEEHGAVRHLRRARRVLRSPAPAVPGGDRHRRVHRGTADRPWYPGPDDHLLAVDPRRLRRLQRLRPHLGAPVPGHLGRGEAGQRHLVPT